MKERFDLIKLAYKSLLDKVQVTHIKDGLSLSISQDALAKLAMSYADTLMNEIYLPKKEEAVVKTDIVPLSDNEKC